MSRESNWIAPTNAMGLSPPSPHPIVLEAQVADYWMKQLTVSRILVAKSCAVAESDWLIPKMFQPSDRLPHRTSPHPPLPPLPLPVSRAKNLTRCHGVRREESALAPFFQETAKLLHLRCRRQRSAERAEYSATHRAEAAKGKNASALVSMVLVLETDSSVQMPVTTLS